MIQLIQNNKKTKLICLGETLEVKFWSHRESREVLVLTVPHINPGVALNEINPIPVLDCGSLSPELARHSLELVLLNITWWNVYDVRVSSPYKYRSDGFRMSNSANLSTLTWDKTVSGDIIIIYGRWKCELNALVYSARDTTLGRFTYVLGKRVFTGPAGFTLARNSKNGKSFIGL